MESIRGAAPGCVKVGARGRAVRACLQSGDSIEIFYPTIYTRFFSASLAEPEHAILHSTAPERPCNLLPPKKSESIRLMRRKGPHSVGWGKFRCDCIGDLPISGILRVAARKNLGRSSILFRPRFFELLTSSFCSICRHSFGRIKTFPPEQSFGVV